MTEITSLQPTILYRKSSTLSSSPTNPSILLKGILSIPNDSSVVSTSIDRSVSPNFTNNFPLETSSNTSSSSSSSSSSLSTSRLSSGSPTFISKVESPQSPTSITKKMLSPESKNSRSNHSTSSSKKAKKRPSPPPLSLPAPTITTTNTSTIFSTPSTSTNYFYAGSDFMNSPDPMTIPIPNFDDADDFFIPSNNLTIIEDKTSALRRILQVK
eukprot:CAMPEP_0174818144 /NCGR_PEP_ID=MMETSP1107-20130205/772_1 /TAXON_ID=36770 /ORGANISM="Paraphysomonas vestita, Strain GFlagA" /LENGTH=212 /DNA_ID=CAMNT_0016029603 /DNA_START=78 /DNA_END=716 /DNA_ORIENTATION=+